MPEDNVLNKEAKTEYCRATALGTRAAKRQVARERMRLEHAFRRLLDGVEREPALADLLAPRGDEGWH